ncbi:MAG: hypothetical protein MI922_03080, partial [Bacteroidales bacterium]|nr:hypothetical protein [Bacteroidales bacterium]
NKGVVAAYVIDRWHPDAMEGLDVLQERSIKTYANELTRKIAKDKGLPVPDKGFQEKAEIKVGKEVVICHFLGEAHTRDGIVVYVPSEKVLFAGNGIRNNNGWVGNIGDANIYAWSVTAEKIKDEYGQAKYVVPGHGNHGGVELIDYTIELYGAKEIINAHDTSKLYSIPQFNSGGDVILESGNETVKEDTRVMENATVYVQDDSKYVEIISPQITYQPEKNRLDSEQGRLKIYDKTPHGGKLRTDVTYKKLMVLKEDDEVGLRIILKSFK